MKKYFSFIWAFLLPLALFGQDTNVKAEHHPKVLIETNQGTIEVELFPEIAPKAVENFLEHARDGYYNNTIFHRVIPHFMIQGGDPLGNGTGGESIWNKPFEDEIVKGVNFNRSGLLAMANKGPATNGSQFFITTKPASWLNGKHTIFGQVVSGYDVVEKIENAKADAKDRPIQPQKILKVVVED